MTNCSKQCRLMALAVGLLLPTLLVVTAPAAATEPTVDPVHDYRLIYSGSAGVTKQIDLPAVPPGVTYTRWEARNSSAGPQSVLLLRSDGRLAGVGAEARVALASVERAFPVAEIRDFIWPGVGGNNEQVHLILADGTVNRTIAYHRYPNSELQYTDVVGPLDVSSCGLPAGVKYLRFLKGSGKERSMLLLRSDGRVTVFSTSIPDAGYRDFCETTARSDYVDGTLGFLSTEDSPLYVALLRRNGMVDAFDTTNTHFLKGCWDLTGDTRLKACQVPKLPRGLKYIDVASTEGGTVYLRSDGRLIHRPAWSKTPQEGARSPFTGRPPQLPTGLNYVNIADEHYSSLILSRSDGQAVTIDAGFSKTVIEKRRDEFNVEYDEYTWHRTMHGWHMPRLAKGWRYVSGQVAHGRVPVPVFLVEKIPDGEMTASGVARVTTPKSVVRGKTAKITVKVASRAKLGGGIVQITHKGKVIGRAPIKSSTTTIRIKTKTMKPKGRNTIGVQYLGNSQTLKSTKAKTIITTRKR